LRGGLVAPITPINVLVTPEEHFTVAYEAAEGGKQAVTALEGGTRTVLEVSVNKGPFHEIGVNMVDELVPSITDEISSGSGTS
jgi:hypothetical protein